MQGSLLEECLKISYSKDQSRHDGAQNLRTKVAEYLTGHQSWADVEKCLFEDGWRIRGDLEAMNSKDRGQLVSRALYLLESFVADAISLMVTSLDRIPDGWILKPELADFIEGLSIEFLGAAHKERIDPEFIPDGYFTHSLLTKSIACFTNFQFIQEESLISVIRALRSGASISGGDVLLGPRFDGLKRSTLTLQVLQFEGRVRNRLEKFRYTLESLIGGLNAAIWQVDSRSRLDIFELDAHFSMLYLHLCCLADSMYLDTSAIRYEKQYLQNGVWEKVDSARGGREIDRREWFDLSAGFRESAGLSRESSVRLIRYSVPGSSKVLQVSTQMSQS